MTERRKDNKNRVLKENEMQRSDGTYDYRWRTADGKRHSIYAKTLDELRQKEQDIQRDKSDGIRTDARQVTVNDIYDMWVQMKKGLKDNTFQNYKYMYEQFLRDDLGRMRVVTLKKSDIRRFYNRMIDNRNLKIATMDVINNITHQVIELAVEDGYLRTNVADNALKELKQARNLHAEKKHALTVAEQNLFLNFLRSSKVYGHWYPFFAVLLGTGMRIGEATGLRWDDVDFEKGIITVSHTLVYYNHSDGNCYFGISKPKTRAGERTIPMLDSVREALQMERRYQEEQGIKCNVTIDAHTNFIFVNRFGSVQHQGTMNKALRRIMRDCNQEVIDKAKGKRSIILLPRFSCHTLRHTFTTRLCESNINIKVIQSVLGHADVSTTLDIYADVTKELKKKEMMAFEDFLSKKEDAQ